MIIIGAVLEGFRSLKDKTLTLKFDTNEPTPEQLVEIALSIQKFGYVAFSLDEFKTKEIEFLSNLKSTYEDKTKTHAQRMKNVLYIAWKQNKEGYEDANEYYKFKMEQFINHIKSKLDPE